MKIKKKQNLFSITPNQEDSNTEEAEEISQEEKLKLKNMETLYPTSEQGYLSIAQKRAEFAKSVKEKALAAGMDEEAAAEAAYEAAKSFTISGDSSFVVQQGDRVFGGDESNNASSNEQQKGLFVTDSNLVVDYGNEKEDDDEPKLLLF